MRVTRVYFIAPLEYFSKSCMSVDNFTRILHAINARVMSLYMLVYVRACMHVITHARYNAHTFMLGISIVTSNSIQCASARDNTANVHVCDIVCTQLKDGPFMIDCV